LQGLKEHGKGIANLVISDAHSGPQSSPQSLIKRHCLIRLPASLQQKAQEFFTKQHLKSEVAKDMRAIFNADGLAHAQQRLKDW
jgi:hypothetical protein